MNISSIDSQNEKKKKKKEKAKTKCEQDHAKCSRLFDDNNKKNRLCVILQGIKNTTCSIEHILLQIEVLTKRRNYLQTGNYFFFFFLK